MLIRFDRSVVWVCLGPGICVFQIEVRHVADRGRILRGVLRDEEQ